MQQLYQQFIIGSAAGKYGGINVCKAIKNLGSDGAAPPPALIVISEQRNLFQEPTFL